MRRRSTFIPDPGVDYDPSELQIDDQEISFSGLKAAREERITLGLENLPDEIVQVLKQSHELHIRWASEERYQRSGPYLSSLPAGLHIQYTPLDDAQDDEQLCPLLKKLFSDSLRCLTPKTSFSRPNIISERFASTASLQYYSLLSSIKKLTTYIEHTICKPSDKSCHNSLSRLDTSSYIDIDYNALSHTLTLSAFWSAPPSDSAISNTNTWSLTLTSSPTDRVELGILHVSTDLSPATEPHELQMEGILAVIGQDSTPKATVFSFPSRHQSLPSEQSQNQSYTVTFDKPTGLHPTLRISFPHPPSQPLNAPDPATCALHTYLTLPSVLFPDQYAFPTDTPDPLFTAAHNILSLRSLSGYLDLEAPDYATQKWGSAMLLELSTSSSSSSLHTFDITIPLHLRYLPPSPLGKHTVLIPHPTLFWACPADDGLKFPVNPFDRTNLGYDGLFGPRTMFYHLDSADTRLVSEIKVPVLDSQRMSFGSIESVTGLLVLSGFIYIAFRTVMQIIGGIDGIASTRTRKLQ